MDIKLAPNFDDLLEAAKKGDSMLVDKCLANSDIGPEQLAWVKNEGGMDPDDNVREFAATVLHVSNSHLDQATQTWMEEWMEKDRCEVVQYRVAIALYKRGNRKQFVIQMFEEACEHPTLRDIALKYEKEV